MIRIADLFCGAGGESTGIVGALGELGHKYDLAAINHWDIAIETHQRNHPTARHFQSDISHLNPHDVFSPRDRIDLLWASPECTHHSNARGGRPRSNQSRASAWLILKWLSELYVRRVIIENVPEFESWGPLGSDGRPLKSRIGSTFQAFVSALQSMGYKVEWQNLCAANYGDPTTRRRFFLQAVRGRSRIEWPDHSHTAEPDLFGSKPWMTARDIIDWSIRAESITARKRPLADATMRRIEAGIRKYWGQWAEPFIVVLRGTGKARSINDPLPTVTAGGQHFGLVEPFFVPFYGERKGQEPRTHGIDEPVPTIPATGGGKFGLVEPFFIRYNGSHAGKNDGDNRGQGVDRPIGTLDTSNRYGLVEPFILPQFSSGRPRSIDKPVSTITSTSRGIAVVEPFILHQATPGRPRGIGEPCPTVTTRSGHALVEPFLVQSEHGGRMRAINLPMNTITCSSRGFGVVAPILIKGEEYRLDITFRMLQPHELAAAQGFPADYHFVGNKTEQVKQIGNSVPVGTAKALALSALQSA